MASQRPGRSSVVVAGLDNTVDESENATAGVGEGPPRPRSGPDPVGISEPMRCPMPNLMPKPTTERES